MRTVTEMDELPLASVGNGKAYDAAKMIHHPVNGTAQGRAGAHGNGLAQLDRGEALDHLSAKGMSGAFDPSRLRVKVFADGADLAGMMEMAGQPYIAGLTTNPTLMRKAGVTDYRAFARQVLMAITDKPISFEVFSDDLDEMERQAIEIASWGDNVCVKVPITNTRGISACGLVRRLARAGVRQNVTAMTTLAQVRDVADALAEGPGGYVSVFAGRIADTGRDPIPIMSAAIEMLRPYANQELIWASPRELLNIIQADAIGCHVITVTNDLLRKLCLIGKNLESYSLETVQMFHDDAKAAGFTL